MLAKIIKILPIVAFLLLLILQLHNVLLYPIGRGFDAIGHLEYINFIRSHKSIPRAGWGWEMYQPPLYYLIAALVGGITDIKIVGFLIWNLFFITACWALMRIYKNKYLALLGGLITVSMPVVIYLTPTVSNELLSAYLITLTLVLYYLFQSRSLKSRIIFGTVLGLSLLSKSTAVVLLVSITVDLILQKQKPVRLINRFWLPFFIAFVIAGWFYLRNLIYYGNPFIINADLPQYQIHQIPGYRDLNFFIDLSGFTRMKLHQAQYDSLLAGTYFSWFYDGHNVILPVVAFSKAGILLVLLSIPLVLISIFGAYHLIRKRGEGRIFLVYAVVLCSAYIVFTLKYPFFFLGQGQLSGQFDFSVCLFFYQRRKKTWPKTAALAA